jgi:hypothetical protein
VKQHSASRLLQLVVGVRLLGVLLLVPLVQRQRASRQRLRASVISQAVLLLTLGAAKQQPNRRLRKQREQPASLRMLVWVLLQRATQHLKPARRYPLPRLVLVLVLCKQAPAQSANPMAAQPAAVQKVYRQAISMGSRKGQLMQQQRAVCVALLQPLSATPCRVRSQHTLVQHPDLMTGLLSMRRQQEQQQQQ